jgi:hypothetical protein
VNSNKISQRHLFGKWERKRQQTALRALAAAFLLRHANVGNSDDNYSILKNVANGAV